VDSTWVLAVIAAAAAGTNWTDALTPLITALGVILGGSGLWAWIASRREQADRRRSQSGTVGTSQADVLWATMQSMLQMSEARAVKAEDQRDKLIDQYQQIRPILEAINEGLRELTEHQINTGSAPRVAPPAP
jgi:hypothetical protein